MPRRHGWLPPYVPRSLPAGLLAAADTPRDKLLVLLLYHTGLRISEALVLTREDLDLVQGTLYVAHGKGDKPRHVGLSDSLVLELRAYLAGLPGTYLFPSRQGPHLCRSAALKLLKRLAVHAGLDPVGVWPHLLRHAYASHSIAGGAGLEVVRDNLGHASLATTSLYLQVDPRRLREAANALERYREGCVT